MVAGCKHIKMGDEVETQDMKEGTGEEVTNKTGRKRKRQLYQSILNLMEFYFSDANLLKSRFMNQLMRENGCKYTNIVQC